MASDDELYDYYYEEEEDDDELDDDVAMEAEDDDAFDGVLAELEPAAPHEAVPQFSAITKEALSNAQNEDLSMVMNLFDIKQHHARAVLMRYRWNKESIVDRMERKGQDVMLMEAGVVLREKNDGAVASAGSARCVITCEVCFEDFSPRHVSTMDCGHSFCNDCWTGHFVASLESGKKQIRCMAPKCPAICDEAVVQQLLGREHPSLAERFRDFLLVSYVDDNNAAKWCPSVPHCGRAIRAVAGESEAPLSEVECPCGHSFCFRCASPAHSPCPCAMWDQWKAKCLGEAENVKWLLANTKTCPKCLKPIIKDGGCNHVTCKCGQYLCWLCGAATGAAHDVDRINGHSCNRFDPEEKKKVTNARRQLRRYEHYYKRFQGHDMSYRSERDKLGPVLTETVTKKLESHHNVMLRDAARTVANAHRSLLGCRQVLSRSYVFAYYMFDEDVRTRPPETAAGSKTLAQAQELFESYQEVVEEQVEKLSKLLETTSKPPSAENGQQWQVEPGLLLGKEQQLLPEQQVENDLVQEEQVEKLLQAKQSALNLAATIEAHCGKMYACIQDELLPMLVQPMVIAAFQKKGPIKAKELPTA